jgi:hypothetical protein
MDLVTARAWQRSAVQGLCGLSYVLARHILGVPRADLLVEPSLRQRASKESNSESKKDGNKLNENKNNTK